MVLNDRTQELNSLLNVRSIKFFELFDENIEHWNGDFGFFSFEGVNIIASLLLFLLLLGCDRICDDFKFSVDDVLD